MERDASLRMNLTKKAIEALTPGHKRLVYHDTTSRGLRLCVEPHGRKYYCWCRKVKGKSEWKNIGNFPEVTVENARQKADEYNGKSARWKADEFQGEDPFERRRDITFKLALEDYADRHLANSAKNPTVSVKGAKWQHKKYLSSWSNRQLGHIRKRDVLNRHKELRDKNGLFTANRAVQLARAVFNWARDHMDWKGENPAANVKLFAERPHQRARFLRDDEAKEFIAALEKEPSRDLQHFIVMAIFTQARKMDILSARWRDVSFEPAAWTIPNPKSKESYVVPLLPEVVTILKERQETAKTKAAKALEDGKKPISTEWVFPSHGKTGHLTGFKHTWPEFLKRAKMTDFRIHDLRRTLASWQANLGTSLHIIGKGLGHKSPAATTIYARLQVDSVRESMERAAKALLTAGKKTD